MSRALISEMRDLSRTPLFAGYSHRQLERADRYCTFIRIKPGRVLYRRGERPETLVILIAGQAMAVTSSSHIQILGPGACLGALAAELSGTSVPDASVALTEGTIAALTARELAGLVAACPGIAQRLGKGSSPRAASATTSTQRSLLRKQEPLVAAITRKIGHWV
jgi:CRP-like cAMP-binding protein